MKVMIATIDRYVREKRGFSILKDKEFDCREMRYMGSSTEEWNGKRPRKSDPLTEKINQFSRK